MIDLKKLYASNNFGNFEIINYNGCRDITIRFIDTGYTTNVSSSTIKSGMVKDKLLPFVSGVGFVGVGPYSPLDKGLYNPAYLTWKNMLARCYCPKTQNRQPTYKGCSVSIEWHNFQIFAKWYGDNYPTGAGEYALDKDIKVKGNKIYAPSFCKFVSKTENTIEASAKTYTFKSPNGVDTKIYNLNSFCSKNNLDPSTMRRVNNGVNKSHKGWTKKEEIKPIDYHAHAGLLKELDK